MITTSTSFGFSSASGCAVSVDKPSSMEIWHAADDETFACHDLDEIDPIPSITYYNFMEHPEMLSYS